MVRDERMSETHAIDSRVDALVEKGYDPLLRGARGTCRIDVEGAGSRILRIDDGAVTLVDGPIEPDCVISASSEDFDRIARGEQNPLTTWLRGDLTVRGEVTVARRVARWLT